MILAVIAAGFWFAKSAMAAEVVPGEVLVKFRPAVATLLSAKPADDETDIGIVSLDRLEADLGVQQRQRLNRHDWRNGWYTVSFDTQAMSLDGVLAAYRSHPLIEAVEPNGLVRASFVPDDPLYDLQWNFDIINMEEAWDLDETDPISGGDPAVVVAVLDTGVAYEDYDGFVRAPDLGDTTFVSGYDFVNEDSHANDDHSHGSHMTGTIAQSTDNGLGVAGLAFATSIMPIKVLDENGIGTIGDIIEGIDYAVFNGAQVMNMSFESTSGSEALSEAITAADAAGVVMVAAAGNGGGDQIGDASVNYPAAYDEVIAVGAVRYDLDRASYSNYGSALDLVAPGGDTSVDQNGDGQVDGILQETLSDPENDPTTFDYFFAAGTSSATAHVSAAAALVIAAGAEAGQVKNLLTGTATDLGDAGTDTEYGAGLIDVAAAVDSLVGDSLSPTTRTSTDPDAKASGWHHSQPMITLIATDNDGGSGVSTTYYWWDDDGRSVYEDPVRAPVGQHVLHYYSSDTAGNIETERRKTYRVDTADPVFDVLNPGSDRTTTAATMAFNGRLTDTTSGVASLTVNGQAVGLDSSKQFNTTVSLNRGTNTIELIARDVAGRKRIIRRVITADLPGRIITGAGPGGGPQVRVFEADGRLAKSFLAYDQAFRGGVNVAVGDVDGDGQNEIVSAPAGGMTPLVRVWSMTGQQEKEFLAYGASFTGGVNVAVGNADGNGADEIITAPASAGGPNIRIFGYRNGRYVPTTVNFNAYDPAFRGGVNLAVLDLEGNGTAEIVTAPASAGGPQLRIFGFRNARYVPVILGLMAFDPGFRGGVSLGGGDVDGDGDDEILAGIASRGPSQIKAFERLSNGTLRQKGATVTAFGSSFTGGISLAGSDTNGDGRAELIAAVRSASAPVVRVLSPAGRLIREWDAFARAFTGGVRLAVEP